MARRRKPKESTAENLFTLPWWVSAVIGVAAYVSIKWLAPAAAASNMILQPLTTALSGFAWLIAGVFFFIALLSFAREKFSAKKGAPATTWTPGPAASHERREPVTGNDPVYAAWRAGQELTAWQKPTAWNVDLLRDLEWKRFEDVCLQFYRMKGIKSETTPLGPDGGIDIRLYQDDSGNPSSIVQCKAWGEKNVGVKPVRELLGVMAHEKIEKAVFMASGGFTEEAKGFASEHKITLVTGDMLVSMIKRLPEPDMQSLLAFATEGDYTTPTCPSCGIKMKHVPGTNGRQDFWGCRNYPRCRQKLGMRAR
jgi:restriction system protein